MKNITIYLLITILLITNVFATGVSEPFPSNLELLPGESGKFVFQIQSVADPKELSCSVSFQEVDSLDIVFEETSFIVNAGDVRDVLATVTAPRELPYGKYKGSFCISCSNVNVNTGGASPVTFNTCGLDFSVDVVSIRTRNNVDFPEKRVKKPIYLIVLIIAIILMIIVLTYYLIKRRKLNKISKKREK